MLLNQSAVIALKTTTNVRMNLFQALVVLGFALSSTGCDQVKNLLGQNIPCDSAENIKLVESSLNKELTKTTIEQIKTLMKDGRSTPDMSRMRILINQIKFRLTDVRTQKSSQRDQAQCTGTLHADLPATLVTEANESRSLQGASDLSQLALLNDLELNGFKIQRDIEYSLRTGNETGKLTADIKSSDAVLGFLSQSVIDALRKNTLQIEHAATTQAGVATAMGSDGQPLPVINPATGQPVATAPVMPTRSITQPTFNTANTASASPVMPAAPATVPVPMARTQPQTLPAAAPPASHTSAPALSAAAQKNALDLANAKLNGIWQATTPEVRQVLLSEQRAWLKHRASSCLTSTIDADPAQREALRLHCEVVATQRRMGVLRHLTLKTQREMEGSSIPMPSPSYQTGPAAAQDAAIAQAAAARAEARRQAAIEAANAAQAAANEAAARQAYRTAHSDETGPNSRSAPPAYENRAPIHPQYQGSANYTNDDNAATARIARENAEQMQRNVQQLQRQLENR